MYDRDILNLIMYFFIHVFFTPYPLKKIKLNLLYNLK